VPNLAGGPLGVPAVVAEHRGLRRLMDELAEASIRLPAVDDATGWCCDLAGRLSGLATVLDRHFRAEEDGLFPRIAREAPPAPDEVRRLREQHGRLLDACRSLAEGAATTPVDEAAFCRLAAHITAFLAELSSHEANESDLMLSVVTRATPPSDPP
jgi:hypothetical protein